MSQWNSWSASPPHMASEGNILIDRVGRVIPLGQAHALASSALGSRQITLSGSHADCISPRGSVPNWIKLFLDGNFSICCVTLPYIEVRLPQVVTYCCSACSRGLRLLPFEARLNNGTRHGSATEMVAAMPATGRPSGEITGKEHPGVIWKTTQCCPLGARNQNRSRPGARIVCRRIRKHAKG